MTTDPNTQDPKPIWQSKTAIVNAIIAASALFPNVASWEASHASLVLFGVGLINVLLRSITKGRVTLFGGD